MKKRRSKGADVFLAVSRHALAFRAGYWDPAMQMQNAFFASFHNFRVYFRQLGLDESSEGDMERRIAQGDCPLNNPAMSFHRSGGFSD